MSLFQRGLFPVFKYFSMKSLNNTARERKTRTQDSHTSVTSSLTREKEKKKTYNSALK